MEELGDDGGDAGEVAGAGGSVEAVACARDGDGGGGSGGVHLFDGGGEEEVYAFGFEGLYVGVEGAGVFGQVFAGAELERVDEDGGGYDVVFGAGSADEGEVAFVEGSHGWDEAEGAGAGVGSGEGLHLFSFGYDLHVGSLEGWPEWEMRVLRLRMTT